mmetsp:Transcript_49162/g.130146  ORF Transcript_49162/g.130146 Transcript_49162/m.130146 type:complete len:345 (-) Transcript_49162:45-1079(-)
MWCCVSDSGQGTLELHPNGGNLLSRLHPLRCDLALALNAGHSPQELRGSQRADDKLADNGVLRDIGTQSGPRWLVSSRSRARRQFGHDACHGTPSAVCVNQGCSSAADVGHRLPSPSSGRIYWKWKLLHARREARRACILVRRRTGQGMGWRIQLLNRQSLLKLSSRLLQVDVLSQDGVTRCYFQEILELVLGLLEGSAEILRVAQPCALAFIEVEEAFLLFVPWLAHDGPNITWLRTRVTSELLLRCAPGEATGNECAEDAHEAAPSVRLECGWSFAEAPLDVERAGVPTRFLLERLEGSGDSVETSLESRSRQSRIPLAFDRTQRHHDCHSHARPGREPRAP